MILNRLTRLLIKSRTNLLRTIHWSDSLRKTYSKLEQSSRGSKNAKEFNFEYLQHIESLVRDKVQNALFVPSMRRISVDKVKRLIQEEEEYSKELERHMQRLPAGITLDASKNCEHDLESFNFEDIAGYQNALDGIARHLQMSPDDARHLLCSLVFRKKSFKLDDEYVEQMLVEMNDKLRLLLQHFSCADVTYNFQLVWYRLSLLKTRIGLLQDLAVQNMRTEYLLHFKTIMSLTPVQLKRLNVLESNVCVFSNLISALDDLTEEKRSELLETYLPVVENMSIARIKEQIIKEYLDFRIQSKSKIMKNFAAFYNLTIQNVKKVLDFIEKGRNGIPLNVVKNTKFRNTRDWSYIILLNAELLHQIDREFNGQFLGKNIRYIVMQSPTIFSSIDNIKRKIHLLQHHYGIPDRHILTHIQVFTLHYNTIVCRIQYWIGVLGRRVTQHKHFLLILRNHSKCVELRRALAELDLKNIPLDLFFFHFHHMRKNLHFYSRSFTGSKRDVLQRLANNLDVDVYSLGRTLKQHKYWKEMDEANATRVYQLLTSRLNLNAEQLKRSIYVTLYDHNQLQEVVELLQQQYTPEEFDEWTKHPLFIELLIYHIEKEHNFDSSVVLKRNLPKTRSQTDQVTQALAEFDDQTMDIAETATSNSDMFDFSTWNAAEKDWDVKMFNTTDFHSSKKEAEFDAFEKSLESIDELDDIEH